MNQVIITRTFQISYLKLLQKNENIRIKVEKVVHLLEVNPFYPGLRTHKVSTRKYGEMYSSRVTGDLRIIWSFDKSDTVRILLLDLGGHSGKKKVYQ